MAGVSWTSNFGNNKILESRLGFTRFAQLLGINNKVDPKSLGIDTGPLSPADFGVPYVYLYRSATAATSAACRGIRSPLGPTRHGTGRSISPG